MALRTAAEARRLNRWIGQLETRSSIFSNARFLVFFLAFGLVTAGALTPAIHLAAYGASAALIVLFAALANHHARVSAMLERIRVRVTHGSTLEAISRLDWSRVPELPRVPLPEGLPTYFADLDLVRGHSLVRLIDQTASTAGYLRLIERFNSNGISDEEISQRRLLIEEWSRRRVLRRNFVVASKLHQGTIDANRLRALLAETLALPGGARAFYVQFGIQSVGVLAFLAFLVYGGPPYYLVPALVSLALSLWVGTKLRTKEAYEQATSLAFSLSKLRAVVRPLERLSAVQSPAIKSLLAPFSGRRAPSARIRKLEWIVGALGVRQNFVASFLCHLPLPWNAFWTLRLESARKDLALLLPNWLEAMAEAEASVSFAEYREANPSHQDAELVGDDVAFQIEGTELKHPLIEPSHAVGNDLRLAPNERCWLITGSNMSGKSTFLRTLGLTLLLAKAGSRVPAARFRFRNLNLGTSLRLADSLEDGFSSFYAEVRQLRGVLDLVCAKRPALYLIDEIFRGTNSRERLIGSRAYIRQLAQTESCGLVTTHDLELISLEKEVRSLANHHFKDELKEGKMSFSYRIASGPCPTTNALKVMRQGGLFLEGSLPEE